jgi:hypothetical protein
MAILSGYESKEGLLFWKKEAKNFCEPGPWALKRPWLNE